MIIPPPSCSAEYNIKVTGPRESLNETFSITSSPTYRAGLHIR